MDAEEKCGPLGLLNHAPDARSPAVPIGRTSANFLVFLDQIVATWEGELVLILDNLSIHKTLDVLLWALALRRSIFCFNPPMRPG